MRLHRFYINKPLEYTKTTISDERLIHQWRHVFRYNVGSEVILFDGSGQEFDAVIEKLNNREAEVRLVSERQGIVPTQKVTLYQSLLKKDKTEWVIEKATELGVSKIVPIISERSEKKGFNLERAQKIAIEASEQCGRADVPIIESSQQLVASIEGLEGEIIVFDKDNSSPTPSLTTREGATPPSSAIFIGPEGGWTEKEIEFFKNKGAQVFSLGSLTLRAETAAIVALTISKLLG